MKEEYDVVILNNCPAFYKINLYNEIAKYRKIFVVFIGYYNEVLIDEDFKNNIQFPFIMLTEVQLKERNVFASFLKLYKTLKSLRYKRLIFGGYVDLEFVITSFLFPKQKNILQTESAGETKLSGIRFFVKKILLTRYSKAIASGSIHKLMLRKMGFAEEIIISKGVGLLNTKNEMLQSVERSTTLKFLYVGRLIELKNLQRLVAVFNSNGCSLTIVGKGELEDELKAQAESNITFLGFINNSDLPEVYRDHDVFILPSLSEAWGLVVEEALYYGCVLALSDRVGSYQDLLVQPETGAIFDPVDLVSFQAAISEASINYDRYKTNVDKFDFQKKDQDQISSYTTKIFQK